MRNSECSFNILSYNTTFANFRPNFKKRLNIQHSLDDYPTNNLTILLHPTPQTYHVSPVKHTTFYNINDNFNYSDQNIQYTKHNKNDIATDPNERILRK